MKWLAGSAASALLISMTVAISTSSGFAASGRGAGGGGGMGHMSGGGFHGGFGGNGGGRISGGGFHDGFHGGFDGRSGQHFMTRDHHFGNAFPGGLDGQDRGHFGHPDRAHWQGGRWLHQQHNGILGWWWLVDGDWFLYPDPIYPYPDYDSAASIDDNSPAMPDSTAPAAVWYYCPSPDGYYPYVSSCDSAWQPRPTVPPMPNNSATPVIGPDKN